MSGEEVGEGGEGGGDEVLFKLSEEYSEEYSKEYHERALDRDLPHVRRSIIHRRG